jgi:hypothetical protein
VFLAFSDTSEPEVICKAYVERKDILVQIKAILFMTTLIARNLSLEEVHQLLKLQKLPAGEFP